MRIAAIDFETATSSRDSACALGAVFAEVDELTGVWKLDDRVFYELIQPPNNEYDYFNVSLHGITPEMTENAETLDCVWRQLEEFIEGHLLIAHNAAFDMSVLRRSLSDAAEVKPFEFLCTYRLAKCTWPNMFSYRLDVLADKLGLVLGDAHHHAGYDALAAMQVAAQICQANNMALLEVVKHHGFALGRFEGRHYSTFGTGLSSGGGGYATRFKNLVPTGEVDESHPVFGLSFAFTGTLSSMSRTEAAQKVVDHGGTATAGPTKATDFLVVGMTDFTRVVDGMSGKMKKALALAQAGCGIEIIDEETFLQMFL